MPPGMWTLKCYLTSCDTAGYLDESKSQSLSDPAFPDIKQILYRLPKSDPGLYPYPVFLEWLGPSLQEPVVYSFFSEAIVATSDTEKGNLTFCQSSEIITNHFLNVFIIIAIILIIPHVTLLFLKISNAS